MIAVTEDGFLDGRLRICQPERGFRAGLDAVMLAAAVPAKAGETVLEMGAGVGTASLCLAARVAGCAIRGIEIEPALVALANRNAAENGVADRVHMKQGDVLARAGRTQFTHVFANPPFHEAARGRSPDGDRARALHDEGYLKDWLRIGIKAVESKGTFTAIIRADRLTEALQALPEAGLSLFPLWPKAGEPAKRVILQARIGSKAAMALLPGLILHMKDGSYTTEANAILRDTAALRIS